MENPDLMPGMEYDVLSYWRTNAARFPVLSEIARDVLAMQVSSVASESAFSTSGRMLSPHRSCLTHFMVEVLMCSEQWMKQDLQIETRMPSHSEILKDLEDDDNLERGNTNHSYSLTIYMNGSLLLSEAETILFLFCREWRCSSSSSLGVRVLYKKIVFYVMEFEHFQVVSLVLFCI